MMLQIPLLLSALPRIHMALPAIASKRNTCALICAALPRCGVVHLTKLAGHEQEDSTNKGVKDLDIVLGNEAAVAILDDTAGVWPRHAANLVQAGRLLTP